MVLRCCGVYVILAGNNVFRSPVCVNVCLWCCDGLHCDCGWCSNGAQGADCGWCACERIGRVVAVCGTLGILSSRVVLSWA